MAYFTAFLDANVLFSPPKRDLLIRLAVRDLYQPLWSKIVQQELFDAIIKRRPNVEPAKLKRTMELMEIALENSLIEDFENLIEGLDLPDPDDRHVLAASIKGKADLILTYNLQDFPKEVLASYNLETIQPDTFIVRLLELDTASVLATMRIQRQALKNPPKTAEDYLLTLEKQGLTRTAGIVRDYIDLI
jgi:predicted nucleic acid-binding protein